MNLPEHMLREIREHAEAAYPDECCGLVLARVGSPNEPTRVRRCQNAQDQFHKLDPKSFPRTNRTAYFVDPKDLLEVEREKAERKETICVIYHSHPDAEAYFSEEDQRRATVNGGPIFPNMCHLVISVINGKAGNVCLFEWDHASRSFVGSV